MAIPVRPARVTPRPPARAAWGIVGLALLATVGVAQESADRLVLQLGAARFADREQAARDLEALGAPALPALRRARLSPDAEIRGRVLPLIERIGFAQAVTPTRVRLDFRERPLQEVLGALAERSGVPIVLDPRAGPALAARPVTLDAPEPVTFWEAIDRLTAETRLRSDLRPLTDPESAGIRSTLVLEEAGDRRAPAVAWGPFRLKIQSLVESRVVHFDSPARPVGDEAPRPARTLLGQLHLSAEPRLSIGPVGPLRLLHARNEQGRSVLPEAPPPGADPDVPNDLPEFTGTPEMTVSLAIAPTVGPLGSRLTLEGVLPVAVVARSPDALVIPLAGAVGKTFEGDDVALTLVAVGPRPEDGQTVLDLSVRPLTLATENDSAPAQAFSLIEQQIELRDEKGQVLPAFLLRAEADGPASRVRVVVVPTPAGGPPVELRYVSLLRGIVEVPFTFRDIPLP